MIARRTALALVIVCLAYAATLLATIPAPVVARAIERASNQAVLLRNPTGTVWAGSGVLYAKLRSGELLELGPLRWKSSLPSILIGHVSTDIILGANTDSTHVDLSMSNITVRGLHLALPGRILAELSPTLGVLGPEGTLLLRSENLRFETGSIFGLADVEWRKIRLMRADGIDLGSHVAHLRGGGSRVDIEFGSISGPLRLSGGGSWTRTSGLDVTGIAEHDREHAQSLERFLQGVCSEYQSSRCTFRYKQQTASIN